MDPVSQPHSATMASSVVGKVPFYKEDEIVVDANGIPHFTGAQPSLLKEYRQRTACVVRLQWT